MVKEDFLLIECKPDNAAFPLKILLISCIQPGLVISGLVHWEDPEGWDGEGGGRVDRDGEHM